MQGVAAPQQAFSRRCSSTPQQGGDPNYSTELQGLMKTSRDWAEPANGREKNSGLLSAGFSQNNLFEKRLDVHELQR